MLWGIVLLSCASTFEAVGLGSSPTFLQLSRGCRVQELAGVAPALAEYNLSSDDALVVENMEYARKACELTAHLEAISTEMFMNDVLPMTHLDEPMELWRPLFFDKLSHLAEGKVSLKEIAEAVVPAVFRGDLGNGRPVEFKPNQTPQIMAPSETLKHGYASCSGLSILVADALRAVGVPARVVGTASWNIDTGGNHNWVEVWWGNEWHFIDATPPGNDGVSWDKTWFIANAAKAEPGTIHGIYTVLPTGSGNGTYTFTWREPPVERTAEDRSLFYKSLVPVEITDPNADTYRKGSENLR